MIVLAIYGRNAGLMENTPSMRSIAEDVCAETGLTLDELRSKSRKSRITSPRHKAMYLMRQTRRYTLGQIRDFFGLADHTTVLHGARSHERRTGATPHYGVAI